MNNIENRDLALIAVTENPNTKPIPLIDELAYIVLSYLSQFGQNRLMLIDDNFKTMIEKYQGVCFINLTNELKLFNGWMHGLGEEFNQNFSQNDTTIVQLTDTHSKITIPQERVALKLQLDDLKQKMIKTFLDNYGMESDTFRTCPDTLKNHLTLLANNKKKNLSGPELLSLVNESLVLKIPESGLNMLQNWLNDTIEEDQLIEEFEICCELLFKYFLSQDRLEEALITLRCTQKSAAGYSSLCDFLIDYILSIDDPKEKKMIYEIILKNNTYENENKILHSLISSLIDQGSNQEALDLFHQFLPDSEYAKSMIVGGFIYAGNISKALELVLNTHNMHIDKMRCLNRVLDFYLENEKLSEAENFIENSFPLQHKSIALVSLLIKYIERDINFKISEFKQKHTIHWNHHLQTLLKETVNLLDIKKYSNEGNLVAAQRAYAGLQIAKRIPLLADLPTCYLVTEKPHSYYPNDINTVLKIFILLEKKDIAATLAKKYLHDPYSVETYLNFLLSRGLLQEAQEILENKKKNCFKYFELKAKLARHSGINKDYAMETFNMAKDLKNVDEKTKVFMGILTVLIQQDNMIDAKKVAETMPRDSAKKIAYKRIEDHLALTNRTLEDIIVEPEQKPVNTKPEKILSLPVPEPIKNPNTNRIATNNFNSNFKWLAKRIVNFAKQIFSVLQTALHLICSIPFYGIKKLSSRLYPERI